MDDWRTAFAEEWDAVVLGTGMKECLLSGLLSVAGKKVLHLDRNGYYGGASASLDIKQLFEKFANGEAPNEAELGKLRDYGVDMVPKFIMAGGQLVKVLIHTGVHNYMEFKPVDGSFVYSKKAGKICRVPVTPMEAMKSSLMGMMEKTRMAQLAQWVMSFKADDPKTWVAGQLSKTTLKLDTMTGAEFFKYWRLEATTIEFLTHSCALYRDESFNARPALEVCTRMQLYLESMTRFAGMTSPYLYPLYGLGELPQAFARLAAVHGGTYMLNRDLDGEPVFGPDDLKVAYTEKGEAEGIKVKEAVARTTTIVGDPSYFPELCEKKGQVVRAIAVLDHPIPGTQETGSFQVIFPGASVNRVNDLYLFCCGQGHKVAPEGKYLAFLSTTVEGDATGMSAAEVAQRELSGALGLMSPCLRIFYDVYDLMAPIKDGTQDRVFISESFDATSHFETAITDVMGMYRRITGSDLVLSAGEGQ
jgi:Rab GDP dissociation inhibitor